MNKNEIISVGEFREIFLNNVEEAIEYETWLHTSGIWRDKYANEFTNNDDRSKIHCKNIINGLLKQGIWFQERGKFYELEEEQLCDCINPNMSKEEQNKPDFYHKNTNKTVELKWIDTDVYEEVDEILYVKQNGKYIVAKPMDGDYSTSQHNADIIFLVKQEGNKLYESRFDKTGDYYKLRYRWDVNHHLLDMYNKYKV